MLLKIMLNVLLMLLEDHISSENISEMYKKTSAKLYNITYFRLNAKNSLQHYRYSDRLFINAVLHSPSIKCKHIQH